MTDLQESLFRWFVSTDFHINTRIKVVLGEPWTQVNALLSFCGFNVVADLVCGRKYRIFAKLNFAYFTA